MLQKAVVQIFIQLSTGMYLGQMHIKTIFKSCTPEEMTIISILILYF